MRIPLGLAVACAAGLIALSSPCTIAQSVSILSPDWGWQGLSAPNPGDMVLLHATGQTYLISSRAGSAFTTAKAVANGGRSPETTVQGIGVFNDSITIQPQDPSLNGQRALVRIDAEFYVHRLATAWGTACCHAPYTQVAGQASFYIIDADGIQQIRYRTVSESCSPLYTPVCLTNTNEGGPEFVTIVLGAPFTLSLHSSALAIASSEGTNYASAVIRTAVSGVRIGSVRLPNGTEVSVQGVWSSVGLNYLAPGGAGPGLGACAPQITQQPLSQQVMCGQTATFVVGVSSPSGEEPPAFVWLRNGLPLPEGPTPWGSTVSGTQTSSLTITNVRWQDAAEYKVFVLNTCGTVESLPASLLQCNPTLCYPNCDNSSAAPVLNVNDFICFQQIYAASDPYANCDGSTTPPVLNINDFICFQQKFAAGCP